MTNKAYRYVRFRSDPLDLKEAEIGLRTQGFTVEKHNHTPPKTGLEISLKQVFDRDYNRDHLVAKADTLEAFLTQSVATLLQRNPKPFTALDVRLRKAVLDLYHERGPGGLSVYSREEPEFDVE